MDKLKKKIAEGRKAIRCLDRGWFLNGNGVALLDALDARSKALREAAEELEAAASDHDCRVCQNCAEKAFDVLNRTDGVLAKIGGDNG